MGTFSPAHWFIVPLMITPLMALLVVPTWRILQRAGFKGPADAGGGPAGAVGRVIPEVAG